MSSEAKREEGATLLGQGRFAEAASALADATALDPSDEGAWRLLGGALASGGDYAGAVPAFERAVQLSPADARNSYNLGVALQGMGREREARTAFETSLAVDPAYQQARQRIEALNGGVRLAGAADPSGIYRVAAPSSTDAPDFGTIAVAPDRPATAGSAPFPALPPIGQARPQFAGGSGGGMAGLASLGGSPSPGDESRLAAIPSQAAPMLRQPGASLNAAPWNPSTAFGNTQPRFVPDPVLGLQPESFQNTSGTIGEVPSEIARGFNFGAAMFAFWWLRSHNLKPLAWWLLVFYILVRCLSRYFAHNVGVSLTLGLVDIAMFFVMGFAGNRIAWQNRRFDDIRDFKACQRIWMFWALPFLVCQVLLIAVLLLLIATKIF